MKLEHIVIKGKDFEAQQKVAKSFERLPDGTIEGMTGWGNVRLEMEGDKLVIASRETRSPDILKVSVPQGSTEISYESGKGISFIYQGQRYVVK